MSLGATRRGRLRRRRTGSSRMSYWLPGVNGVFDDNMQQAVYAFQKANGLPAHRCRRPLDPGQVPHRDPAARRARRRAR